MAIEFRPGRYYLGMWYLDVPPSLHPPEGGNWMACAWREENNPNEWTVDYRHRYYAKEELGRVNFDGSKDRFSWYRIKLRGGEADVIRGLDTIIGVMGLVAAEKPDIFWIRGDVKKFIELVETSRPHWLHMKIETDPERIKRHMARK